jgi:hypothetical protein
VAVSASASAATNYLSSLFCDELTSATLNLIMSLRMGQSALQVGQGESQPSSVGDHELGKVGHSLHNVRLSRLLQQLIIS